MNAIIIKTTKNPSILKFEFDHNVTRGTYEFKNIDEAGPSPLAKQLFYLPFIKSVMIHSNFIALERYQIVAWEDVQEEVKQQIEAFVHQGGKILLEEENTTLPKQPFTVYSESTPNPNVMKYVANKTLTKQIAEYKNIDECESSPLAKMIFQKGYAKEVFIDENYVSVTKFASYEWMEINNEIRSAIKEFLENGGVAIDETLLIQKPQQEKQTIPNFDHLDTTSQQIVNILEEYVKPAVQADGGNILFDSFEPTTKKVKVILQGSCNGCPSSTFTLKNGIENMLKQMLHDETIVVEAL